MTTINFIVGKSSRGYDAYYEKNHKIFVVTTGGSIGILRDNALKAYNIYAEKINAKHTTLDCIVFKF